MIANALPRLTFAATARLWRDAPAYTAMTLILAVAALPLLVAWGVDGRQFQGESVWIKPLKFHVALVIFLGTLAFYARWVPVAVRQGRFWRWHMRAVVAATAAEVVWIGAAAALGSASHFSTAPVWAQIYPVMGLVATVLTAAALVMGLALRKADLPAGFRLSLVTGLVLTFVLTMVTAWTMATQTGHHVGVPLTGAAVPLLGWSREVGDLRVAHFFATHALHALPVVGLLVPDRPAPVWLATGAYAALVVGLYLQGLAGLPVI